MGPDAVSLSFLKSYRTERHVPANREREMASGIKRIEMKLPLRTGTVNAYLVETNTGFVLIDTGATRNRGDIEWSLEDNECRPGELALILLTHGDFDHIGNARHLRKVYRSKIAMHKGDWASAREGDMFASRETKPPAIAGPLSSRFFGFKKAHHFKPDLELEHGERLGQWGLNAKVIRLEGHSGGSIGVLTADKDLFCGDLLANVDGTPALHKIMDDSGIAEKQARALADLEIRTVYPGHGEPFDFSELEL